jgi:hypothetical protein
MLTVGKRRIVEEGNMRRDNAHDDIKKPSAVKLVATYLCTRTSDYDCWIWSANFAAEQY